jgi:hypothetical protein
VRYVITKRPNDVFWIDEIRAFYAALGTRTRARFVICIRDPRAVLTSRHEVNRSEYWVTIDRWRSTFDHYQYARRFADVCVVEYADLVLRVRAVQERLTNLVGWTPACDFDEFHRRVPENFDTRALNGVRRLDANQRVGPLERSGAHRAPQIPASGDAGIARAPR